MSCDLLIVNERPDLVCGLQLTPACVGTACTVWHIQRCGVAAEVGRVACSC